MGQQLEYTWFSQRIGFIRNTLTAPLKDGDVDSTTFKCDVVMGVPAGYDLVLTTKPYYQSTYVLLIAKGRGFDTIKDASQLTRLSPEQQDMLKIAMFDRGPGTDWIQKNGLLADGIPYQSMTGDGDNNVAMQIDRDFKDKKINMVILWGPMAAFIVSQSPAGSFTMIPMKSSQGIKFDFAMAMGVRKGDKARKEMLNKLIAKNSKKIQAIIESFGVPLVPLTDKK
jgi:hypothetical protein